MFKRLLLPLLIVSVARAADPVAGPIIGHVTDSSARVWMQFPVAGQVTVNVIDETHNQTVSGVRADITGPTPFVCDLPLSNLQPNTSYRLEIKFDGEVLRLPGPPDVRTAPPPGDETAFSVAFGSGIHIAPEPPASLAATQIAPVFTPHKLPIFSAIAEAKPRAFFLLGNAGILPAKLDDFPTTHRAAYSYITDFATLIRREPDLQPLFRSTPVYSLFSDRDIGPAGADASYVFLPEALLAFQRFNPNPDWGTPKNPGCFSMTTFGDVDFFLLDARTFRTDKALLGVPQLEWLEKNLKASRANFKILAAPCTLWGDDPQNPDPDSWSRFDSERADFLKWLASNNITGILSIAGNQSAGRLTRVDAPADNSAPHYPLFTLGTSTLYAGPLPAFAATAPIPAPVRTNPNQRSNPITSDNFGTLNFTGSREHRTLTLHLHDATGKAIVEQVILASQLKN